MFGSRSVKTLKGFETIFISFGMYKMTYEITVLWPMTRCGPLGSGGLERADGRGQPANCVMSACWMRGEIRVTDESVMT